MKKVKKNCELCGKEMEGHPKKKQCDSCRKKENARHRENWRKNHPLTKEQRRNMGKKHYQEHKDKFKQKNKEYNENNKDKKKTWKKTIVEVGKECYFCSSQENLVRHHTDYSKPNEVITLCRSCHTKIHNIISQSSKEQVGNSRRLTSNAPEGFEKQVEELEKEMNELKRQFALPQIDTMAVIDEEKKVEKKAKLLKASIEKGCGITTNLLPCSCGGVGMKIYLCSNCKNLINRLNKIIGENDD